MGKVKKKRIRNLVTLLNDRALTIISNGTSVLYADGETIMTSKLPDTENCFNAPEYKRGYADACIASSVLLQKLLEDES